MVNEWFGVDLDKPTKEDFDNWNFLVKRAATSSYINTWHLVSSELYFELVRLRNAVRAHRNAKGDDRCWLDDVELYKMLPDTTEADFTLPPRGEFLASCERYCDKRQPKLEE